MRNLANQESLIWVGHRHTKVRRVDEEPNRFTKKISGSILQEELRQKIIETALIKHELNRRRSEHALRVAYASGLFILVRVWLIVILLVVIAAGSSCKYFSLEISDHVLIALLTTTTVSVLGLFFAALKYVFGRK